MFMSNNGMKLKQCSIKNGQLTKDLKLRRSQRTWWSCKHTFVLCKKESRPEQHITELQIHWGSHSIETVTTIISAQWPITQNNMALRTIYIFIIIQNTNQLNSSRRIFHRLQNSDVWGIQCIKGLKCCIQCWGCLS